MQTKRDNSQGSWELIPPLEQFVPANDPLRRLKKVLDLEFVHDLVRPLYCQDNGAPSIDPEVIVRLFLLQAYSGIPSVRRFLREAHQHMGYRWFIGYGAMDPLPDHSALSRVLDRFGDELFNEIFSRSIAQCKASGLVEGKMLHLDATTIRADLVKTKTGRPGASDPDARFGRFPGGAIEPGYKQQTVVDDASRVITAIDVRPADENEGSASFVSDVLEAALEQAENAEVVCADGAYGNGPTSHLCEDMGVRLVSPPPAARNHLSGEQFPIEAFAYDEATDVFVCPAGKLLERKGRGGKPGRWKYMASAKDCGKCPLKEQCTKSPQRSLHAGQHHASLVRLRQDSKTAGFKRLYRRRSPVIEGIFAEAKENHGLRRAWRRGLMKMRIQCLIIAAVMNFKRLAAAMLRQEPKSQEQTVALQQRIACFRHIFGDLKAVLPGTPAPYRLSNPICTQFGQCHA
jgi:transposase